MSNLSILGEKRFSLSQAELILIGGDGASWIKEGAQNYFPNSIYQLCKFHLERNLKKVLYYHKEIQRRIRGLLQEGEIGKALEELHQEKNLRPEYKKDLVVRFLNIFTFCSVIARSKATKQSLDL
jgi:transposase-like protein